MKKLLLSTAVIAAFGMFAGSAMAASSAFDDATITAIIVQPTITIKNNVGMTFGSFGSNSTGEVKTNGLSDDTVNFSAAGLLPSAARFEVSGDDNFAFDITLSNPVTMVGVAKGGVDGDLTLIANGDETVDRTTTGGKFSFEVNGILDLGDAGDLTGGKLVNSFIATVAYK